MFYEQLFHDKRKLEVDLQIYEDLKYAKYSNILVIFTFLKYIDIRSKE